MNKKLKHVERKKQKELKVANNKKCETMHRRGKRKKRNMIWKGEGNIENCVRENEAKGKTQ